MINHFAVRLIIIGILNVVADLTGFTESIGIMFMIILSLIFLLISYMGDFEFLGDFFGD